MPPLPDEAKGWKPARAPWQERLHSIAELAGDPYRPTLNPPPPRNARYKGDDPHVRAMLEAILGMYTARR